MEKPIYGILFGAPGSGKGFYGECMVKELVDQQLVREDELLIISTGDLIRAEVKSGSELGSQIKAVMERGEFVSNDIVERLLDKKIIESKAKLIFFDGYPRTVEQVNSMVRIAGNIPVIVVHRDTPEELILERVSRRRICSNCGKVQTNEQENCIACHGELTVRKDDAVIKQRLDLYNKETKPALEELKMCYGLNYYVIDGQIDATISAKEFVCNVLAKIIG